MTTKPFRNADRVSHKEKGLGTVTTHPARDDVVVLEDAAREASPDTVFVTWDDARFPVGAVPQGELEKVPDAAAAISTGQ